MKLNKARFCVGCEELFEGVACPKCGRDDSVVWISEWMKPPSVRRTVHSASKKVHHAPCALRHATQPVASCA